MTNKKKLEEPRLMIDNLGRRRKNIFYYAISIIVAIIVVAGVLMGSGILQTGSSSTISSSVSSPIRFSSISSVESGEWTKVSSSDIGQGGVNIYFLSWEGCPIGASDSFAIYHYFHANFPSLSNSTMIKAEHFSDPSESPSDIPGLLFNNFTATSSGVSYSFHVVYVYGETLPPDGPTSVNAGISTLKAVSGFPSAVINMLIEMQTSVPTAGLSNQAIANYAGHLTSSLIVTGPNGAYYFEGEMYNPSDISGISPSTLLKSISSYSYIITASSNLQATVGSVYSTPYYYKTTFTETGLLSGTKWYVNLTNGMKSGAITGTSYSFELTNSSYAYTVQTSNKIYKPSPYSSSFTVNGKTVSETITFSPVKYAVTFTEHNLSSGTTWYINVNGHLHSSNNSTITVYLNNDTYHYTVTAVNGYTISKNAAGNITVNGNNVSASISFTKNTNYTDYYIIGGIVAAIVIIGGVFVFFRIKK